MEDFICNIMLAFHGEVITLEIAARIAEMHVKEQEKKKQEILLALNKIFE